MGRVCLDETARAELDQPVPPLQQAQIAANKAAEFSRTALQRAEAAADPDGTDKAIKDAIAAHQPRLAN